MGNAIVTWINLLTQKRNVRRKGLDSDPEGGRGESWGIALRWNDKWNKLKS